MSDAAQLQRSAPGDFPFFSSLAQRGLAPTELIAALRLVGPVGEAWEQLALNIMTRGRLPAPTRELVILRVAFLRHCEYIWGAHYLIADDVGLRFPIAASSPEVAVVQATDELLTSGHLCEMTRSRLNALLGLNQLVELIVVVNHYVSASMIIEARGIGHQDGAPDLPATWPGPAAVAA